jgi:trans-2,3-dihydro-3-hydroxyanthranilate isomerase
VYLFTRETVAPDAHLHIRMFGPDQGIVEDPATGSSAGCVAAYAAEHGYLETTVGTDGAPLLSATLEQGLEMGRPSLLKVRAQPRTPASSGSWSVTVGGHSVVVAEGTLR